MLDIIQEVIWIIQYTQDHYIRELYRSLISTLTLETSDIKCQTLFTHFYKPSCILQGICKEREILHNVQRQILT